MRTERKDKYEEKDKQASAHGKKFYLFLGSILLLSLLICTPIAAKLYKDRGEAVENTEKKRSMEEENSDISAAAGVLEFNKKKYRRNTAVRAILCIGVDSKGDMVEHTASGQAGQADGLFLVAQDMARDTVKILMIPRDTMTEITLFDLMGNELGKDVQHLTLAFAYGDGREKSCELLREAVSNLCFGLHIDGYLAMNISSISRLNDELGGVTVTIQDEGLDTRDPALVKGQTVLLNGEQAEIFVRYRNIDQYQTAISRMDRQKQYMQAYLAAARKAAAKDSGLITRLMNTVQEQMITNMAKDQYLDMGLAIFNSEQQLGEMDFLTVPGEVVETNLYEEYHPDQEKLKEMIVELFYKEA